MVNVVAMEMLRTKIPPSKCPLVSNVVGKTTCSYFPKYCSKRQEAVFGVESCEAQMCFHKLLFSKILQQEARGSIYSILEGSGVFSQATIFQNIATSASEARNV